MALSIIFSETPVKAKALRISERPAGYDFHMAKPRDRALSDYVRVRIREWMASGKTLIELARVAKISNSAPSQVLSGLGVGGKAGPGFARAFGFRDYDELVDTAYRWWLAQQQADDVTPAMRAAMDAVVALGQTSEAQVRAILADYTAERFRARDAEWWTDTLLREARLDREAVAAQRAVSAKQAEHRALTRRRVAAPVETPAVIPPRKERAS